MKNVTFFFTFCTLVAFSPLLYAQDQAPAQTIEAQQPTTNRVLEVQMRQSRALTISGIALTFSGLGITIIGTAVSIVALVNWGVSDDSSDSLGVWGSMYIFSVVLTALGALTFVGGIPLWIVGARRERQLARDQQSRRTRILPLLAVDPSQRRAVAGVSLVF